MIGFVKLDGKDYLCFVSYTITNFGLYTMKVPLSNFSSFFSFSLNCRLFLLPFLFLLQLFPIIDFLSLIFFFWFSPHLLFFFYYSSFVLLLSLLLLIVLVINAALLHHHTILTLKNLMIYLFYLFPH